MNEMVERVALALKAELGRSFDAHPLHGDTSSGDWHATGGVIDLEECARVAITAMREPTGKMCVAAIIGEFEGNETDALNTWTTMIDVALAG